MAKLKKKKNRMEDRQLNGKTTCGTNQKAVSCLQGEFSVLLVNC